MYFYTLAHHIYTAVQSMQAQILLSGQGQGEGYIYNQDAKRYSLKYLSMLHPDVHPLPLERRIFLGKY